MLLIKRVVIYDVILKKTFPKIVRFVIFEYAQFTFYLVLYF